MAWSEKEHRNGVPCNLHAYNKTIFTHRLTAKAAALVEAGISIECDV